MLTLLHMRIKGAISGIPEECLFKITAFEITIVYKDFLNS